MIYIETDTHSSFANLACEEYFLKSKDLGDEVLMLWQDEPAVVVGRFQNTLEEINQTFIDEHHIQTARRISGGGAVYHDLGNLCFSFILPGVTPGTMDASRYIRPVEKALSQMGIPVMVAGRNDLTIDGKKFSGNAMALHKNRLLFHGTLLFDTDLDRLGQVLKTPSDAIESKGIKSVRSRVTNIRPYAPSGMDLRKFKQALKELFFEGEPQVEYQPTSEDFAEIQKLVDTKYRSWDWIFGRNPASKVRSTCSFAGGKLEIELELDKGWLAACRIQSDALDPADIKDVELRLANIRFTYADIEEALTGVELKVDAGSFVKDELIHCIMRD
jgi:lipoate---protein ligase